MTHAKHARTSTTGRKLAAGALSVPMALTMAGTAAATEPVTAETTVVASTTDELLAHDALAATPAAKKAELPAPAGGGQAAKKPGTQERPATSSPATSNSAAVVTLDVVCGPDGATVNVQSDKDISNVKVYYADGTKDELNVSDRTYKGKFMGEVVRVTAKSGTTEEVVDCSVTSGEQAPPKSPSTPGEPIVGGNGGAGNNGGLNSEADVDLAVQCVEDGVRVVVGSDKDISNVKVFFADGTFEEFEGLDGYEFDEIVVGDVVRVTAKSGTIEVEALAEGFAECVVTPGAGGATGNETPAGGPGTPGQPAVGDQPLVGGEVDAGTGTPPSNGGGTPVVETPVVSTPGTPALPVSGQPAPSAGSGVGSTGVVGAGASAPQAFAPTRTAGVGSSTASPTTLPFTGSTTPLLLALGTGLVVVGGGLALSGRRESAVASA